MTAVSADRIQSAVQARSVATQLAARSGCHQSGGRPLLIQRFGELSVAVAAGTAVDAATDGVSGGHAPEVVAHASLAVAPADVLSDRAASAAVFEVGGTRSVATDLNLHHFWRNARTHALHDPIRWKYQHIGRALLHDTPPPLHGVI